MNISNNGVYLRSMDAIPPPSNQQQQSSEQTILLNAIRNKFANNSNKNLSGTSPPVFSIPNLKLPTTNPLDNTDTAPSKLNQFIRGQLSESKTQITSGVFEIPNLQIPTKSNGTTLTLAEKLQLRNRTDTAINEGHITQLNRGINDLQVSDENEIHVIDLTTALNRQSGAISASPSKALPVKAPLNPIDFQIPFIDCDLKEPTLQLPAQNEYCEADVSDFVYNRFISAPSRFGKITCLRYRLPVRTFRVDHSFKVKHNIARFGFNTKSPDDVILASLQKYNRL